jgi:REP element-mobilizing transposase RayT
VAANPLIRPGTALDEFVIMPDHMHGIIVICEERNGVMKSENNLVGAYRNTPRQGTPFRSPSGTLGAIIRGFKGSTTKRINQLCGTAGKKIWQRNYYEHIVRDERDLLRIQNYIRENPLRLAENRDLLNHQ